MRLPNIRRGPHGRLGARTATLLGDRSVGLLAVAVREGHALGATATALLILVHVVHLSLLGGTVRCVSVIGD